MATTEKIKQAVGKITRVVGVVVDVEFSKDHLPAIYNALEVMLGDKKKFYSKLHSISTNRVFEQ